MPPSNWSAETDRKMLLIMLKDAGAKFDLVSIASQLTTDTWQCTAKAVENRYYKLKSMAKAFDEQGAQGTPEDGAATAEPKTPKKRGRKPATAKGKKTNSDGEDNEEKASPKKRARKAAIPKEEMKEEMGIKDEEADEQQVSKAAFSDVEDHGQTMIKDEPVTI